jgi:hypothetical protein
LASGKYGHVYLQLAFQCYYSSLVSANPPLNNLPQGTSYSISKILFFTTAEVPIKKYKNLKKSIEKT